MDLHKDAHEWSSGNQFCHKSSLRKLHAFLLCGSKSKADSVLHEEIMCSVSEMKSNADHLIHDENKHTLNKNVRC